MEYVNLLLYASSAEMDRMRGELGDFLHQLNGSGREYRYELGSVDAPDTGDEVGVLRDSRFLCVIAGKDADEAFLRDFDNLLTRFGGSAPEILAFAAPEAEDAAFRLAVRLRKEGAACGSFSHPDAVKLDLLLRLDRRELLSGSPEFRDGQALVNGTTVLSLGNVPMYAGNQELNRLLREREEQDRVVERLREQSERDPENSALLVEQLHAARARGQVIQQIHETESALLELCQTVAQSGQSTWRVRQAGRLLEQGNFPGALEVLQNDRRQEELDRAERVRIRALQLAERQLDKVRDCVREDRLRIAAMRSSEPSEDVTARIRACYEQTLVMAEKYMVELDVLYEYVEFLWEQQDFEEALEIGGRLSAYYAEQEDTEPEDRAALEKLLGNCCMDGDDNEGAEAHYRTALQLYRALWRTDEDAYGADLASVCADFAALLQLTGRLPEAEAYYRDALELRRKLARSSDYAADAAETCVRLANMLSANGRTQEAEQYYREVLDYARRPASALFASAACRNLAGLLEAKGNLKDANRCYQAAAEGFRTLSEEDPDAWAEDAATVIRDYAVLLDSMGRSEEAEPLYREALGRIRALYEEDPERWEEPLALTCGDLANLLNDRGRPAEALYREALDRCGTLAEREPGGWDVEIAEFCGNLAKLLAEDRRYAEAEPLCRDALQRFRFLAEEDQNFDPDVARNCALLGKLYRDTGRPEEAEPLFREALDRMRELEPYEPEIWSKQIAAACGNLAALLNQAGEVEESEELYREALDRFRQMSDVASGSADAAAVCRELADLLGRTDRPQEGERLYCDALDAYRKLAEKRPAVYEPEVAMTSNNLAVFLKNAGRPEAADWFYRVALDAYRKLAKKDSATYAPYVAATCSNLASLLSETGRNAEAERFYRVALDAWRRLAENVPEAYEPDVADTCGYLAVFLLAVKHETEESKALYKEALSIYEKHPLLREKAAGVRMLLRENYPEDELEEKKEEKKKGFFSALLPR